MAAPSFRSAGTLATAATNANVTPGSPAGATTGDVLILVAFAHLNGPSSTDVSLAANGSGWQDVANLPNAFGANVVRVWAYPVTGSAPTMPTVATATKSGNYGVYAQVFAFSGADLTTIYEGLTATALTDSASSVPGNSITTTGADRLGVHLWFIRDDTRGSTAGWTEQSEATSTVGTIDGCIALDTKTLTSAGTEVAPTRVLTASEAASSVVSLALLPVASGPDTTAPTITSSASVSVAENTTLSHSLTADETVTWSITGGADQAHFELSGSTLRWASNGTKDYEAPGDADGNNTYVVQVTATDGASNATNQTITVTVTDVAEGSPGDPWTPTEISTATLAGWFDASDAGTITSSGGAVSAWGDKSGNGVNASQGSSGSRPSIGVATQNGLDVVTFGSGGDKKLSHSAILAGAADYSAFYVLRPTSVAGLLLHYYHSGTPNTGSGLTFFAEADYFTTGWGSYTNAGGDVYRSSSTYPTPTNWAIHVHQKEHLYKDGAEVSYGGTANIPGGSGLTTIGGRPDASLYFIGHIAEIVVCGPGLSDEERQKVEGYLAHKWGLAGNLPSGHPYKSAAPQVEGGGGDPQTYNESISLGSSLGQSNTGRGAFPRSISVGASVATAAAGGLSFASSLSLGAGLGLTDASVLTAVGAIALPAAAGASTGAAATFGAAMTLPASVALSGASAAMMGASLAMAAELDLAAAGGSLFAAELTFAASPGITAAGALSLSAAISLAAQAAVAGAATPTLAASLSLGASLAASAASQGVLGSTLTLQALAAMEASGGARYAEALELGASVGLSAAATQELVGAIVLAASAAQAASGRLTMAQALDLAAQAGLSGSGHLTMEAVASLAVAASLAAEGALEGRTYSEVMALGVATLIAQAQTAELTGSINLGARASASVASQAVQTVAIALAASLSETVAGALALAQALDLDVSTGVTASGALTVTGSISLPASANVGAAASVVLASGLTFEASFDAEAASALTTEQALALAVQASVETAIRTGIKVIGEVGLSGAMDAAVDLPGTLERQSRLSGTLERTINLSGLSSPTQALSGQMQLTIRLSGRLN